MLRLFADSLDTPQKVILNYNIITMDCLIWGDIGTTENLQVSLFMQQTIVWGQKWHL